MKNLQKSFISALLIGTGIILSINPAFAKDHQYQRAYIKITNNCSIALKNVAVKDKDRDYPYSSDVQAVIQPGTWCLFDSDKMRADCNYGVSISNLFDPRMNYPRVMFKGRKGSSLATLVFGYSEGGCQLLTTTYSNSVN